MVGVLLLAASASILLAGIWLFRLGVRGVDSEYGFTFALAGLCVGLLGVLLTLASLFALALGA